MAKIINQLGLNDARVVSCLLFAMLLTLIYIVMVIYRTWVDLKSEQKKLEEMKEDLGDPDLEYVNIYERDR